MPPVIKISPQPPYIFFLYDKSIVPQTTPKQQRQNSNTKKKYTFTTFLSNAPLAQMKSFKDENSSNPWKFLEIVWRYASEAVELAWNK